MNALTTTQRRTGELLFEMSPAAARFGTGLMLDGPTNYLRRISNGRTLICAELNRNAGISDDA
jgi:hypothetical protein